MASADHTVTIHLPARVKRKLEKVAASNRRSPAMIAAEAIAQYVASEESDLAAIELGVRDADAGRLVEHEEIKAWLAGLPRPRARRR